MPNYTVVCMIVWVYLPLLQHSEVWRNYKA